MKPQHFLTAFAMLLLSIAAFAEELVNQSAWSQVKDTLTQTWQSQNYELYIPVNIWHNRSYYSKEKIDSYNENPGV
jgi:palmitoyl transferase